LGFTLEYARQDPLFGFLSYHGCQLMIQQQEPTDYHTGPLDFPYGRGINFQIATPDIATLIESLQQRDYPLRRGLQEHWRAIGGNLLSGTRFTCSIPIATSCASRKTSGARPLPRTERVFD